MKELDIFKIEKRVAQIAYKTGCGHVASALGVVEPLCLAYNNFPDGIIILSEGHACLAQYVILNELGRLPDDVLKTYYKNGGLSGHSTLRPEYGIYASTGSLGHGVAIGIGYAIANPKRQVVVVCGDGETNEGSVWEAMGVIRRLRIPNIAVIVNCNDWQGMMRFEDILPPMATKYYSVKGEGFEHENKLESHYMTITEKDYLAWKQKATEKDKRRKDLLIQVKNMYENNTKK